MAVVMTAHRRPDYLRAALESWARVRGMQDLALFRVSLDASDRTAEMIQVIAGFPVNLRVNDPPLTVEVNPAESVTAAFREFPGVGFAVLAEEDLVVSDDVLEYMRWASREFRDDKQVAIVCAQPRAEGSDPAVVRSYPFFSAVWIWGTWRDRWFDVIEPTWDRDYSSGDAEQPKGGWDYNLDYRVLPRNGLVSVAPDMARAQNIGQYEGVHAAPGDFPATQLASFREHNPPTGYRLQPREWGPRES
jgi:hypothetical protein